MKRKSILAALLLLLAGLQTTWAQGFRVYKSDGTVAQFSMRTDSIVFYDDIGTDVDFGPFTPVNQCIVGTWYKSKNQAVTFNEDGTTDYISGGTYEFTPYQGNIIIYNASGAPINYIKVLKVTADKMIVALPGSQGLSVWSTTPVYVDFGLPSGTIWASCNIGASKPEEVGDYFAWGETAPKDDYSWATYSLCNGSSTTLNKYCLRANYGTVDGLKTLLPGDDAATAILGEGWSMPTREQFEELLNGGYTSWTKTEVNGVQGIKVTSTTTAASIFLPIGGYRSGTDVYSKSSGYYWTRNMHSSIDYLANAFAIESSVSTDNSKSRFCGLNIRPVASSMQQTFVTGITLNYTSLSMQVNATTQLTATVAPADADNTAVAWESSDKAVATVDANGLVTAKAAGSCTITCSATDGSGVKATCQVTVGSFTPDEHEYVDLDLPSGTLWATCNVGASKPEEYGDYFAWGETKPKSIYNWSTYKWCNGSSTTMTKYCTRSEYGNNGFTDNLTELQPEDDAATANWGSGWKMPSLDQIKELFESYYTTSEWTQLNGVYGYKITSKSNGNSIFLPAAGERLEDGLYYAGKYGNYWSSSLGPNDDNGAYFLYFGSGIWDWDEYGRGTGHSVRAVRVQE